MPKMPITFTAVALRTQESTNVTFIESTSARASSASFEADASCASAGSMYIIRLCFIKKRKPHAENRVEVEMAGSAWGFQFPMRFHVIVMTLLPFQPGDKVKRHNSLTQ